MEKHFAHVQVFLVVMDVVCQRNLDKMKVHGHYAVFFMGSCRVGHPRNARALEPILHVSVILLRFFDDVVLNSDSI